MWPDPENMLGDQDIVSPGRLVSSGLQVPGEPGHCRAKQDPLLIFPLRFPSKCPSLALRVDSLALSKIINEEDAVLIPKNRGENFSGGILYSEFFRVE
jgi:hypothetical protein